MSGCYNYTYANGLMDYKSIALQSSCTSSLNTRCTCFVIAATSVLIVLYAANNISRYNTLIPSSMIFVVNFE